MLLTLRASQTPAKDFAAFLGLPLDGIASFDLSFGRAHAFLPEATDTEATAAVTLDVDPWELAPVDQRLYAVSPLVAEALARAFAPILEGPEQPAIVLEARLPAFPCKGGEARLRNAFEPLGYAVTAEALPLDPAFPEWGAGRCFSVTLRATLSVRSLLGHLRSLIPVLTEELPGDPPHP